MLSKLRRNYLQAVGLSALLAIVACGQTGPLVLPSAQPSVEPATTEADNETDQEEDEE